MAARSCSDHWEPRSPFRRKIMSFKPHWTLAFLLFASSRCFADGDHEMEEFLKREYSLSKPYQGNAACTTDRPQRCTAGWGTDFSRTTHRAVKTILYFHLFYPPKHLDLFPRRFLKITTPLYWKPLIDTLRSATFPPPQTQVTLHNRSGSLISLCCHLFASLCAQVWDPWAPRTGS